MFLTGIVVTLQLRKKKKSADTRLLVALEVENIPHLRVN
jgi:hypothetical protein